MLRHLCRRSQAGFTLLELLVVVLIIGLLTSIVGPRFLAQINRSEVTTARAQMDSLGKAIQAYRIDMGQFPPNELGLRALVEGPGADPRWRGPYLNGAIPVDPWGVPYQYRVPGTKGRDYDLVSLGSDRAVGGTGDDADLTN
jgi:general secretion pathway protein G